MCSLHCRFSVSQVHIPYAAKYVPGSIAWKLLLVTDSKPAAVYQTSLAGAASDGYRESVSNRFRASVWRIVPLMVLSSSQHRFRRQGGTKSGEAKRCALGMELVLFPLTGSCKVIALSLACKHSRIAFGLQVLRVARASSFAHISTSCHTTQEAEEHFASHRTTAGDVCNAAAAGEDPDYHASSARRNQGLAAAADLAGRAADCARALAGGAKIGIGQPYPVSSAPRCAELLMHRFQRRS